MPLFIKVETLDLEEGDPIPFFQNVLMLQQMIPPAEVILPPPPFSPPPLVDQSWLTAAIPLP